MTIGPAPMCYRCGRYTGLSRVYGKATCDAFPKGIPDKIFHKRYDHRKPYEGDNDKQFINKE